ncbi:hypothetical protein [Planctomycetes bacterium TBK1r]|uniref:Uncharacterized protein n=1 Tax=Stieleria magnilauensis TaxID=2527963 RepID=A0ABX5XY59_9BACT|nr:hypothetical protein TBK1r_59960 [Planctomycetes bacterium TBK1r]QDV87047.1 hypothetical protein TBK1r_60740 [Planctomycetes bacterium TBK1r]
MRLWAWKDTLDKDAVSLGVRIPPGNGHPERFSAWCQIHIDGIGEIFGPAVAEHIRDSDGNPLLIEGRLSNSGKEFTPLERD